MERQALIDASIQPSGRCARLRGLELIQAFVDTVDREHGSDLLDEARSWRAWCSMRVCGGRAKARAYYLRQRS